MDDDAICEQKEFYFFLPVNIYFISYFGFIELSKTSNTILKMNAEKEVADFLLLDNTQFVDILKIFNKFEI